VLLTAFLNSHHLPSQVPRINGVSAILTPIQLKASNDELNEAAFSPDTAPDPVEMLCGESQIVVSAKEPRSTS
jgi:hypothetical protein